MAEAASWLGAALGARPLPPVIAAIGLGEGYLLDVLEQVAPGTCVLALEPDPAAARRFHERRDWSRWRSANRLTYLTGPAYAGADDAWRMFPGEPDDHLLLVNPAVARGGGEAAVLAARTFKAILFGARANATARRKFAPRYLLNSLANLPAIVRGVDVSALTDAYRGTPAVIVGAGPSLDDVRQELARCTDRALLIATDTALRPLLSAGIRPPIVVGVDPGSQNARHFHGLVDLDRTWLVAESALDSGAVAHFEGRTFWFRLSDHEPWPWYQTLGVEAGHLKIWGSVLTAAFQVAVLAGCDPIVFVGADLGFTGGRPYARGTTYEFDWAYSTAIGDTLDRAWRTQMAMCDPSVGSDARGRAVATTAPLLAFRDWMITHASRSGRRVVNATGAGILVGDGIEQRSLGEVLDRQSDVPSPGSCASARPRHADPSQLAARCRVVVAALDRSDVAASPLPEWTAFAGGSIDAQALGSVLSASADHLDNHRAPSARAIMTQAAATYAGEVLDHMPEALARLRAWINGTEGAHTEPTNAAAALATALSLLGPTAHAILEFAEQPGQPLLRQGIGLTPVSGSRSWPADIAWTLQTVEALIGDACRAGADDRPAETVTSFFTRRILSPDQDDSHAPHSRVEGGNRELVAQLFDEWTRCACGQSDDFATATHVRRAIADRLRVLAGAMSHALVAGASLDASTADTALVVEGGRDGHAVRLELPLGSREMIARAMTGALRSDVSGVAEPARPKCEQGGPEHRRGMFAVGVRARGAVHRLFASGGEPVHDAVLLTPRVLTDEGIPRAMPGYSRDRSVVCAPLHGVESFVLREDGRIEPHLTWDRPMCAILPLGESGAVAWNNGTHNWPEVGSGYVMYRTSPRDAMVVQDLPFGPTAGAWSNGRLYWTTYPRGFASWAPGESGTVIDPDLTLVGIVPTESALQLGTCERRADGGLVRRRMNRAWCWAPGSGLSVLDCGVDGSSTCRSTDTVWEATAFPDSDLIRLRHRDGRSASLTCHYPYLVAWAGESLVVATIHGELLLFEQVQSAIDRMTRR